ncbi:UDP-N-acetylglucosamine 1-carboxyvinyltransferase [Calorimonas adulescens]|jgi:UDP-N-acetylglucosamine 1-carboxyvinyltransferase|uniref:UDP-N-acetylglucosamine 1-carboxyvinyltransferase n=1 Tax=Calorimonas adulescens TaxID=2606906 RepID=A0A5D8QBY6_9THEO|nr:UDP-N-acetylglucosamine 1-carboxyvinyltransferase [Calorimonas adulescens]TZE81306.1 UDP-N-acetylglucosamine 1-carboxyvinyltransferase [Calorimonas adulescens]
MRRLIVEKSPPLHGIINVSGSKNAVLPIMAACILANGEIKLEDIPKLEDVLVMERMIKAIGLEVHEDGKNLYIKGTENIKCEAPYDLVRMLRASFLVMGPILARKGKVRIALPGGCNIGSRPVDLHLKGFRALGAEIDMGHGYVEAHAQALRGNKIYLDFPSVGATENIMMAAILAKGVTILENAAEEPEIVDLANFLNEMGAKVVGAGTDCIRIEGVEWLKGTSHTVIPDRIEAGTYMIAAAMTGGRVVIRNVEIEHLKPIVAKLTEAGVAIDINENEIVVDGRRGIRHVDVKTLPYPGFPTDLQPQMMAMLSIAQGTSIVIETVFENRFQHVPELKRMGADIKIEGRSAVVQGVDNLTGAEVKATDLRAGAALVLAGLVAERQTEVTEIQHIHRGYVDMKGKLEQVGARIREIN